MTKKLKVLLTVALAVMISVSAVWAVTMSVDELKQLTSGEQSFGAFPGNDIWQDVSINGGLTSGVGSLGFATSSDAGTLTAYQMRNNYLLDITVNTGATKAITLPSASVMASLMTQTGNHREWLIHNATSSTMAMTITAGANMNLIGVTTNDDVIDETEYSELDCTKISSTKVTCKISELLHVD